MLNSTRLKSGDGNPTFHEQRLSFSGNHLRHDIDIQEKLNIKCKGGEIKDLSPEKQVLRSNVLQSLLMKILSIQLIK